MQVNHTSLLITRLWINYEANITILWQTDYDFYQCINAT